MIEKLKIDEEFKGFIPPLSKSEFKQLEYNILTEGEILNPILTWNGYIIDGHHRYQILLKHPELKYKIEEKEFADRTDVLDWICDNQLGRRNLSPKKKKYLLGKRYELEKASHGGARRGDAVSTGQDGQLKKTTRQRLAEESCISESSVRRAYKYACGLDAADEIEPGFKNRYYNGEFKCSNSKIESLGELPPAERRIAVDEILSRHLKPKEKNPPIPDDEVTIEDSLNMLEWYVKHHIKFYKYSFDDHPDLLSPEYFDRTMKIMKEMTDFIKEIESIKEN